MRTLSRVFALLALLTLGYWTAVNVKARFDEKQKKQEFSAERTVESTRTDPAPAPVPSEPAPHGPAPHQQPRHGDERVAHGRPRIGAPIAMLEIPRVGISAVIIEGAGERELRIGPGHISGTALPGEGGNVGVAGHRDTSFRPLRHLRPNDLIKLTTSEHEYCYTVGSMQIVNPSDVHVLYPTERETLTLVTCYPFTFIGHAPKRFIVRAEHGDCSS